MHDQPVRCGLIGFGLFGRHHARILAGTRGAELAAIAVRSEQSQAAAKAAHPQATIYGDYRALLDRQDIELVDVVVPNHLHFEIGSRVLDAGKHLLIEKPLAVTMDQCDALIRAARDRQKLLAVGHELRLSSLWGGAKQLIDQGAIGRPQHVLVELSRFPYRPGSAGWRYDLNRVGNWILEEPIHFFDLARWYLERSGEPQSVYARANSRQPERTDLCDNFSCIVDFADGAYAVVSQTLAAFGHHQTAKIAGTDGTIWANWSAADARSEQPQFQLRYGLGQEVHEVSLSKPAGELLELADEIAAVVEAVRSGSPPPCSGEDGRWSALLCLAASQSVRTGHSVQVGSYQDH